MIFKIFLGNFKSDRIFRNLRAYSSVWLEHLSYKQKAPSSNLGRLINQIYIVLNIYFIMIEKKNKISKDNEKLYAFLSCFFTIVGFVVAFILWKDNKYIMYYAKHGLVLFVGQIIIAVISPFFLFFVYVLWILWIILWIITWMNSFSGKIKKTFLVSDLADKIVIK